MKMRNTPTAIASLIILGGIAGAQEKIPPAGIEGVKGVKQDAVEQVQNIETGTVNTAKDVNKVDGVNTINGVKVDGRAVIPPVQPVVPPPVAGNAVKVETGTATGTATTAKGVNKVDGVNTINGVKAESHAVVPPVRQVPPPPVAAVQPVQGVAGINTAKLKNLEAALKLKHDAAGAPTDKGKAAAAALGGPGPGVKPGPKQDGRAGFQEFQKLQTNGS
jgi:hypothetical protein